MSKSRTKWDDINRHNFYADMLAKFGEWKFWASKTNPFHKKEDRLHYDQFDAYLEEAYEGKKPKAQLSWLGNFSDLGLVPDPNSDQPTQLKERIPQPNNHRNFWQNKSSAYYADFVGDEVFPDTFKCGWSHRRDKATGQDKVQGGGLTALNENFQDIPPDNEDEIIKLVEPCSPGRHSLYPDCNFCPNCGEKLK